MKFAGKEYKPYNGAFNNENYSTTLVERKGSSPIPHRSNKVTTIDEVMEVIEDGDTISYPHYYRTGDKGLQLVVSKLGQHGKKGIILYGNAFFDNTDPWLLEAYQDGTLAGLYGNPYRKFGANIMAGKLPCVSVGFSHGNRVRKLQSGEVKVKVAFGPVPIADTHGNSNGYMGKQEHLCGPLGFFAADAEYAEYVCLLAATVSERLILPAPISMEVVDFVIPVDEPSLNSGIATGTLNIDRARAVPYNAIVAENIIRVMDAAKVVKNDFNFQVGSGAGLLVLDSIRQKLREQKIMANFAIGGVTGLHVDLMNEGLVRYILDVQMFDPAPHLLESIHKDVNHVEITGGYYASVAGKECSVNMLDFAVLSALEIDLNFNVNTVCANGRIIGGIGGGQDVAAGAALTVMFLPLATGKEGKGFPKVVDKVYTVSTPGEVVDIVVTEEYAALNPNSKSPYKDAIIENAKSVGLQLVTIEELYEKSKTKAAEFGITPPKAETTDEVVHIIEWRDGTLLDTLNKLA